MTSQIREAKNVRQLFMRMRDLILWGAFCTLFRPTFALDKQAAAVSKPVALQCESLTLPMGVDTNQPLLSWKLQDGRAGARQTAYRILVGGSSGRLATGKADVWDSGRVESDQSVGIVYGGPKLEPQRRYYWRVQVWDKENKPYPLSDTSWWETGLMGPANWQAKWIGYEDPEHEAVRAAKAAWVTNPAVPNYHGGGDTRHDLRLAFDLEKPVASATLYATGEDTVAAWINGRRLFAASQRPPWGRLPWRTYASAEAVSELRQGKNLLAIEAVLYGHRERSQTPVNAVLYVKFADGSSTTFKTGDGMWKAAFNASGEWYAQQYDDSSWALPEPYPTVRDAFGGTDGLGIPLQTPPVTALRRRFTVNKPVASARLYVTALGAYRMSVNGTKAGDQILSPGWTDYRQRVVYQVLDVTPLLHTGENALGAYLAPGWYDTPLEWVGQGNNYGATPPALKAQLRIEHLDGSVDWIVTDDSWKADDSPILSAEIYNGETYDARRFHAGWDTSSFRDTGWHPAALLHPHEPQIVWQSFHPIRVTQMVAPKAITSPAPDTFIYDFGQNLAGVARIQVQGRRGTDVRMRFGEQLNADGTLFVANLRNAKATDHFILSGHGLEKYEPTFTFHGFRYLEITGVVSALPIDAVKAVVFHTDAPETVQLKTGSPMVNQLWGNILWGQRSNFVGVPTDCPQRDERLGWSADAQVFWRTAVFNMDLTAFSRKYAADLRSTQSGTAMYGIYAPGTSKPNPGYGPGWSDAGVIVPWTSWLQSGDKTILEENWDSMDEYLAGILDANPDYLWKKKSGIAFGDWLAPEGPTAQALISTAYWAYDVSLMQQMARALGRDSDEQRYAGLFEKIKAAFDAAFVRDNGVVGGVLPSHNATEKRGTLTETQTGYVLALNMNLLPESLRPLAAQRLVERIAANGGQLGTGFLGTPHLLEVLTDTGHADVAYSLLLNTKCPSWGYMVQHGATTMWERWNGDQMRNDPGMNSYNHYAYGAVAEWIYRYAAGIDTTASDPGFHTILLHPNFDTRLGQLDLSYESPYGTVRSRWTATQDEVTWTITIPPNARAQLPLASSQVGIYFLDGHPITQSPYARVIARSSDQNVYELAAGTYSIKRKTP